MPTKFSEYFDLASDDVFQKRVYDAIKDATTIVECYFRLYDYIVGGLKWSSRKNRHDLMDDTVDLTGFNKQQMEDAEQYFEGSELVGLSTAVLFEYLDMVPQDETEYGPNVYSLEFKNADATSAQKACRQVQLYLQLLIYNREYARQAAYREQNHIDAPLKNGEIPINPQTAPVNPEDPNQFSRLTDFVNDLIQWVKDNYPVLQAVLKAKPEDLFPLVFVSNHFTYKQKIEALDTMLDKVRCLADSKPASTHKAFGMWVVAQLKDHPAFWNNTKISKDYDEILTLEPQFNANAKRNLEIYQYFKSLFADFLSTNRYEGESDAQAETRRETALGYIEAIFVNFLPSQQPPISTTFKDMMAKMLQQIKTDYEKLYTDNLQRASAPIPPAATFRPILPNYLADAIKEKADEFLRTLPLLLKDKTKVRFFAIQNFEDLKALNEKSVLVLKPDQTRSSVVVPSDPSENGVDNYRPIYRPIRFSTSNDRYIAFCNLPNLAAGTFYYRHVNDPSIVAVAATNVGGRILTIDFQNFTINYPGKADRTRDASGLPYRTGASTVRFFDDLKHTTKWTTIAGVRRYDPYYTTNPADASKPFPHLTGYVAAGRGASRTLPLGDDSLCLWVWNCSNPMHRLIYEKLGEILGLPATREIVPTGPGGLAQLRALNTACTVQIGGAQYSFVNYGPYQFKTHGFFHPIIGLTKQGETEEFYVQINTPTPGVAAVLTGHKQTSQRRASRPLADTPQDILDLFNFTYWRRITNTKNAIFGTTSFTGTSKVIQLFKKGDKRKPSGSGTEVLTWPGNEFDAIGANLPICFNVPENVIQYYVDKQSRGKIINKGNVLYREQKPRKDAGTAMKPIHALLKPPLKNDLSSSKVPATAFADGSMTQSTVMQNDWGLLKGASCNYMPINQEWCHLRGHGDGGEEYPGNFVSGSIHCNTEQLAIETGQRLVTQQMPERTFILHTTAYLLRDAIDYKSKVQTDRDSEILSGNYLKNEDTFKKMLRSNTARRSRELRLPDDGESTNPRSGVAEPRPQQGDVAPLAAYLRYKVMRCKDGGGVVGGKRSHSQTEETRIKFFDFIFEGQSEFIDVHQFTLISRAVQFALADAEALKTWYEQEKSELDQKVTT